MRAFWWVILWASLLLIIVNIYVALTRTGDVVLASWVCVVVNVLSAAAAIDGLKRVAK